MRRSRSTSLILAALAVAVLGAVAGPPAAEAAGSATLARSTATASLYAVSASTATDAWAVGHRTVVGGHTLGLIKHWDGSAWTIVPSPHPGDDSFLWGVHSLSPTDAWAVGETLGGATILPMAEHWNGTDWQLVPIHGAPGLGQLNAVSAVGPDDVWMVGTGFAGPGQTADKFIVHWDGTTIHRVKSGPLTRGATSELTAVTAVTADDVWAVGSRGRHGTTYLPLIEHYDGTAWTVVPGYHVGGPSAELGGVDAVSGTDAWAVGWDVRDGETTITALAERWNGTRWTHSPAKTPGYSSSFTSVSAVAGDDVWAVGSWIASADDRRPLPLIEHWDGHAWSIVGTPSARQHASTTLNAVSMTSPADGVTVGARVLDAHQTPYALHWDGTAWAR